MRSVWPIRVQLIKEHVKKPEDALLDTRGLHKYSLRSGLPFRGSFFLKWSQPRPLDWLRFVQQGIRTTLPPRKTSSTSGVLFVRVRKQLLALTFGFGYTLLNRGACVPRFGLMVALNSVNPARLRSVDAKTIEELTLFTRRQASAASTVDTFGLDISRDLLRAVSGEPVDRNFARRVAGSDALVLVSEIGFRTLGRKLEEILDYYERDTYKERFGWIDHLQPIDDPMVLAILDIRLVDRLRKRQTDGLSMAPPEPLDWVDVEGFLYPDQTFPQDLQADLDIEEYLRSIPDGDNISPEYLRSSRIRVKYVNVDAPVPVWSVYDSLVLEISDSAPLYVLSAGDWFQVEQDFAASVSQRLAAIPTTSATLVLPEAAHGEREDDYNRRAVDSGEGRVLLDRQLIRVPGAASDIEVCDILTTAGHFVHLKKRTRSATLSHLFAQGLISAEAFLQDAGFRVELRDLLNRLEPGFALVIPVERPDARNYEVVYAVIARPAGVWPSSLPFFSQLNLVVTAERLQGYGYRVSLLRVGEL